MKKLSGGDKESSEEEQEEGKEPESEEDMETNMVKHTTGE